MSAGNIEAVALAINAFMAATTADEAEAAKVICRKYREVIGDQDAFTDALEYARVLREAQQHT